MKMSKQIPLLATALLLSLTVGCQNMMDRKAIAYYSFDGDDFMDLTGNANHGLSKGVMLTTDRFGNENSAYQFDGKTSNVVVNLKDAPPLDSNFSISWWYLIESTPAFREKFDAQNMMVLVDRSQSIGLQFGFRGPGYKSIGLDTWQWGGRLLHEVEMPAINQWHHCAYTFNGKTHRFYLDGELKSTSETTPHQGSPKMLMLGNSPYGVRYFKGKMDDLQIIKRTLNDLEILKLSQPQ